MHISCTHPQHPKKHTREFTHTHTHIEDTCSQPQTITDKHTGLCQFHLHPFQAIKQDTKSPNCCVANRFWGKNDTIAGVKRQHTMRPSLRLSHTDHLKREWQCCDAVEGLRQNKGHERSSQSSPQDRREKFKSSSAADLVSQSYLHLLKLCYVFKLF